MRIHAKEKQKVSGWTGFNISVRNKVHTMVSHDVMGYLPTIDAPDSYMATVHRVVPQDQEYAQVEMHRSRLCPSSVCKAN